MKKLEVLEEVPVNTVISENEHLVYTAILDEIEKVYDNSEVKMINVLRLVIGGEDFTLPIKRDVFPDALKNCLKYFEKPDVEEYEKCSKCLNMINYLNKL
jgi:hypothetical protein